MVANRIMPVPGTETETLELPRKGLLAKRRLPFLALVLAAAAAGFYYAASERANVAVASFGKALAPTDSVATTNSAGLAVDQPAQDSSPGKSAGAVDEVERLFSENIPTISRLTKELHAQQEALLRDQPNILLSREYAQELHKKHAEKHAAGLARWQAILHKDPKTYTKFYRRITTVLQPWAMTRVLSSSDPVGSTSIGAMGLELVQNSDYFEILRDNFALAVKADSLSTVNVREVAEVETPEALVAQFQRLSAVLYQQGLAEIRAVTPDPSVLEYLVEDRYIAAVWSVVNSNEKSWSSGLDEKSRLRDNLVADLQEALLKLPSDSPEHDRLRSRLGEAYFLTK